MSADVYLSPQEASDHATYMAALKKAAEQGGVVVVDGPEVARLKARIGELEAQLANRKE